MLSITTHYRREEEEGAADWYFGDRHSSTNNRKKIFFPLLSKNPFYDPSKTKEVIELHRSFSTFESDPPLSKEAPCQKNQKLLGMP